MPSASLSRQKYSQRAVGLVAAAKSQRRMDDARVARGIWRSACGRVQVMFSAYRRGAMTAGPDVVRKPGPNQTDGLNTHVSQRALLADRSTVSHHAIITLAIGTRR